MGHEGSALTDGETEGGKESREGREENVDHHRPFGFAFTRHNRQHFKGLVNHWLESTSLELEFHATPRPEHFHWLLNTRQAFPNLPGRVHAGGCS